MSSKIALERFNDTLNDIAWPDTKQPIKQHIEMVNKMIKDAYDRKDVQNARDSIKYLLAKGRSGQRTPQDERIIQEQRHALYKHHFLPIMAKTAEVKRSFFEMLKEILSTYVQKGTKTPDVEKVLRDWRGSDSQSGHMKRYVHWQKALDVTELVNKDKIQGTRQKQDFMRFYKTLIQHPSL